MAKNIVRFRETDDLHDLLKTTGMILQIYSPEDCPQWIKEKCENLTETKNGARYTTYKAHGTEIVYYTIYKGVSVSVVLDLCQKLDEQQLNK